jgi:hypothetical protein
MLYLDDRTCQIGLKLLYVQSLGPSPLLFIQNLDQFSLDFILKVINTLYYEGISYFTKSNTNITIKMHFFYLDNIEAVLFQPVHCVLGQNRLQMGIIDMCGNANIA